MPQSEPERYNLDEMIDRLKGRSEDSSADEGQWVTRADGTKALRVRKRKRRTEQPHKELQRRRRVLQVTGALVALLLLVLGLGCLTVYVNSPPFRNGVVSKIAWATGADVQLKQFRMNPSGANAGSLDLNWPGGNVLQSASLRLLRADVSPMSYFGGSIGGQELDAATASLVLRSPDPRLPSTACPEAAGESSVQIRQCEAKQFTLLIEGADGVALRLSGSEAMFIAPKQGNPAQLILSKGDLQVPGWSRLQLDRAHIEFQGPRVELVGLRVNYNSDTEGLLDVTGWVAPYEFQKASVLRLGAEGFLWPGIAGEDFGNLFSGRVDAAPDLAANELVLGFGPRNSAALRFGFRSTLGQAFRLRNFPFLYGLAQTLEDEWYSQPEFDDAVSGVITRTPGQARVEQIELASKGRMVVRGDMAHDAQGRLSGRLQVGVAHGMIKASENRVLDRMFGPPREDYRWVELEIGGSVKDPADNFGKQYEAALASMKDAPQMDSATDEPKTFEELTRPR